MARDGIHAWGAKVRQEVCQDFVKMSGGEVDTGGKVEDR
jgi:hypothetical protein